MTLRTVEPSGADDSLADALRDVPWVPYRRGFGLDADRVVSAAVADLDELASGDADEARVLLVRDQERVVGGLGIKRHPYETEVFELPVARTAFAFVVPDAPTDADDVADRLLAGGEAVCSEWGCRHWSLLLSADDRPLVQAAVRRGWLLADSTVDLTWDLEKEETRSGRCTDAVHIRLGGPDDAPTLSEMTFEAYTLSVPSRYMNDPRLPLETVGRLFSGWTERACQGTFADAVAVAELDGRIVGFDMLKLDPSLSERLGVGVGRKGIAAVDPEARGNGILSGMEAFLNRWQHEKGGRFNSGRTLFNNLAMQAALKKVGGRVTAAFHTFHVWPEEVGGRGPGSGRAT